MEICKNKSSNRYFIYIQDTGNAEMLLITPEAQVKSLKTDLFNEVEEQEESYLLQSKQLTEDQIKRFHEYKTSRSDEVVDQVIEAFNEMSPYNKKRLLQKLQIMIDDK